MFQKKTTPKLMIEGVEFPEEEIAEVRDFVMRGWVLGERHGLKHWQRVERNGILLSMNKGVVSRNVSIKVVRYFAYLHDFCRLNELKDYRHGQRAAELLAEATRQMEPLNKLFDHRNALDIIQMERHH